MFLIFALLAACTGDDGPVVIAPVVTASVPPEIVAASWQVRMAKADVRAPFEGRPSWVAWYETRRPDALAALASESDPAGLARAHTEYAAIYRQSALLAANAILQVYGADIQPSDPAETAYLLGVLAVLVVVFVVRRILQMNKVIAGVLIFVVGAVDFQNWIQFLESN